MFGEGADRTPASAQVASRAFPLSGGKTTPGITRFPESLQIGPLADCRCDSIAIRNTRAVVLFDFLNLSVKPVDTQN